MASTIVAEWYWRARVFLAATDTACDFAFSIVALSIIVIFLIVIGAVDASGLALLLACLASVPSWWLGGLGIV